VAGQQGNNHEQGGLLALSHILAGAPIFLFLSAHALCDRE